MDASCSSSVYSHDVGIATPLLHLITVVQASTLPSAPLPFVGWDGDESLSTSTTMSEHNDKSGLVV